MTFSKLNPFRPLPQQRTFHFHYCFQDKAHSLHNLALGNLKRLISWHWASLLLLTLFISTLFASKHFSDLWDPPSSNSNVTSAKSFLASSSLPPWWHLIFPQFLQHFFLFLHSSIVLTTFITVSFALICLPLDGVFLRAATLPSSSY